MDKDPLDVFCEPPDEPKPAGAKTNFMVVRARAKSSEEIDAIERGMLFGPLDCNVAWPVPMYESDWTLEPLSKDDVIILRERFGVTEAEYRLLYERRSPLP